MDFDFCQLLYTAIADIYRFWLKPGQRFQDKWRPRGHVQTAPAGSGGVLIITYADSLGVIASDAIIYNGHEALRSGAASQRAAAASAA